MYIQEGGVWAWNELTWLMIGTGGWLAGWLLEFICEPTSSINCREFLD
jgi:hypothetical protein